MSARHIIADVLLVLAVLIVLASSVGILVMRDVYARLHYVTPISLVAPVLVALAIGFRSGWSANTAQTWLALLFLLIASPVLAHATMRAARIRGTGDWRGASGGGLAAPPQAGTGRD